MRSTLARLRSPIDVLARLAAWGLTGIVVLSGYGLAKLEPFGPAASLELTSLDLAIPFWPWTVWLYGTVTWACLAAWLTVPDLVSARRLLLTLAVAAAACWIVFFAYPTTYPRELYPIGGPGDGASIAELWELREADSPSNCLPSMHVALAFGLALAWRDFLRHRVARALPLAWAIIVSACTLTTKQHYVVDVPAGVAIGLAAWWLVRRAVREGDAPFWSPSFVRFAVDDPAERAAVAALRAKVEAHQWRLRDVPWPDGPLPRLDTTMVRLLNEVIYVEETAGKNFRLLADATDDPDLHRLYLLFEDEERRHADGLRKVLALHGAPLRPPGLGNSIILSRFDTLDPRSAADAALVAVATPVFETFLDAGTIPFLRDHPALRSPAFEELVRRICRDEAAHLALDWLLSRELGRRLGGLRGLVLLCNPNIYLGIAGVPFLALDTYALAYRLGYDFRTLLPAFGRLWRLHRKHPELRGFPLWWLFRVFVVAGVCAAVVALGLARAGLLWGRRWTSVTRVTDAAARVLFGRVLLERRGLPPA